VASRLNTDGVLSSGVAWAAAPFRLEVTASQPPFVEHGDIGDALFLGWIIGGAEAMTTGTDDNDIAVAVLIRLRPLLGSVLVGANGFANQGGKGKVSHCL